MKGMLGNESLPKHRSLFGCAVAVGAHHFIEPFRQGQFGRFYLQRHWVGIGDEYHVQMACLKATQKCLCLRTPANAVGMGGLDRWYVELERLSPVVEAVPIQFSLLAGKHWR